MTGRFRNIAVLVLSFVLAALFLFSGGSKLAGVEQHVQGFAHWRYPDWFRVVVGVVEVVAAILLLIPRFAFVGAVALIVIMAGATYTHLFRATGEGAMAAMTVVLLVVLLIVAAARWRNARPFRSAP